MLPIPSRKTFRFGSKNFGLRIAGGQGDDPASENVDDQVCEQLLVMPRCTCGSLFECVSVCGSLVA